MTDDLFALSQEYQARFGVPCPMPAQAFGSLRVAIEEAFRLNRPIPADWDPYADLPDDAEA